MTCLAVTPSACATSLATKYGACVDVHRSARSRVGSHAATITLGSMHACAMGGYEYVASTDIALAARAPSGSPQRRCMRAATFGPAARGCSVGAPDNSASSIVKAAG